MQPLLRRHTAESFAIGLGLFSIGLGLVELLFPRTLTRPLGMKGDEGLVRLYGLREIATGVGLLAARKRAPWLWGRVAGDALDIATLAANGNGRRNSARTALALGAVAGVTVLDAVTAESLDAPEPAPTRDYSDRSGFPGGLAAARGAARDFVVPRDMRANPVAGTPTA